MQAIELLPGTVCAEGLKALDSAEGLFSQLVIAPLHEHRSEPDREPPPAVKFLLRS
jgi:hypothetical protein